MRNPLRLLVATGALVGTLVAAGVPAQAHGQGQIVLDQGHVDVVGVAFEDGALDLHVHDESVEPGEEYQPGEVKLVALPGAETAVPADPAYAFLGAPGSPVWILPQVQDEALLWPGFGAEELEPGAFQNDVVTVTFKALAGPGRMAIYTEDAFGLPADIFLNSGDGLPDSMTLAAGDHLHVNWAFSKAGHYLLLVKVTGTLATTGQTVSDSGVYHFQVLK